MKPLDPRDIEFGGPARYRIIVRGVVGEEWVDRLAGLEVTGFTSDDGEERTRLLGAIRDQAELKGVLDILYGLHLPIIEIETVGEAGREESEQ